MKYKELRIEINRELLNEAVDRLACEGFTSLMIDDPAVARDILDHPDVYKYDYLRHEIEEDARREADAATVTLYFGDDEEGASEFERACRLLDNIKEEIGDTGDLRYESMQTGDDSEWLYKWQEFFKTSKVGERIVIKPSWESYEPKEGELVIEMDPGMAFGSGQHETTSMCIKALEKYVKPGMKVLDVGTGTGVLAMAAALLGAGDCLGIDIDEEAVRVARGNIEKNGLGDAVKAACGDLTEGVDYRADIIAANLMADLVIKLAPSAAKQLSSEGIFISSGILDSKCEEVEAALRNAGFEVLSVMCDGEWRAIVAGLK